MNAPLRILDDCWNRIGIGGDHSCPELERHVHCRNCPVHAAAAARLLDRPAELATLRAAPAAHAALARSHEPMLLFRIGDEWLGLSATVVQEIVEPRPVHALPHRRSRAVRGITNIRGTLTVCYDLGELLGIAPATREVPGAIARMLVVGAPGRSNAILVDAVYGIERFAPADELPVPGTVGRASTTYTRALVRWREHSVGLPDAQLLLYSIDRNLA